MKPSAITLLFISCVVLAQNNILAGKRAVFENRPDYSLTRSDTDAMELTDGKFREGERIWFFRESVGWYASAPVHSFYYDLGGPQDIGKVRVHASAGAGGVQWPEKLLVLAGDSPNSFMRLEDLSATERDRLPEYGSGKYTYWFESTFRPVRARYLKFIVFADKDFPFFFSDEIQAFAPSEPADAIPQNRLFTGSTAEFLRHETLLALFRDDCERIIINAKRIGDDSLPSVLTAAMNRNPPAGSLKMLRDGTDFPVNDAQAELAGQNLRLLWKAGIRQPTAWWGDRWAPFHSFEWPEKVTSIEKRMLPGERRSLALCIANASADFKVRFRLESDIPVTVHQVVCSMTSNHFFNANRLEPLFELDGFYTVNMQPGESRMLFLTIEPNRDATPGDHSMKVVLEKGNSLQCNVLLGKVKFPERLSSELGFWDYLNSFRCHGQVIDESNLTKVLAILDKYQMNLVWAHESALPFLKPEMFNGKDELVAKIDFGAMDRWLKRVGPHRSYALFLGGDWQRQFDFGRDILKENPQFRNRVVAFLTALAAHLESCWKISADNVLIHCIDEACTPEQEALLDAWCDAVAIAASPSGRHFVTYGNPAIKPGEVLPRKNMAFLQPLCPYDVGRLRTCVETAAVRPKDLTFGFYSCLNRSRERDPYSYYALPFRFGFLLPNFRGVGFWNLGTAPRGVNECDYTGRTFSAMYFDGDDVLTSRQWEAIFEGREDYEYLLMLRNMKSDDAAALRKTIAAELEKELDGDEKAISLWNTPKDRTAADRQTALIWNLLQ